MVTPLIVCLAAAARATAGTSDATAGTSDATAGSKPNVVILFVDVGENAPRQHLLTQRTHYIYHG